MILRPDSVRRVRPPKTTMPKTLVADARSQRATPRDETSGKEDELDDDVLDLAAPMLRESAPSGDAVGCAAATDDDWDRV